MVDYWSHAGTMADRGADWPRYQAAKQNYLTLALPEPILTEGRFATLHPCGFWNRSGLY